MKQISLNDFLQKVTNGNGDYVNSSDWINGKSGFATFNLDENQMPITGEVKRGSMVLGAISLNIKTNEGTAYKERVTPFNLSMLSALKNKETYTMKIPFLVEQRVSAKGNPYQQILFDADQQEIE